MKLATFRSANETQGAVLIGETLLPLGQIYAAYEASKGRSHDAAELAANYGHGVLGFVQNAERARKAADWAVAAHQAGTLAGVKGVALGSVQLLAPIPKPPAMRDGYAFRQHVVTARRNRGLEMIPEFDEFPVFYFTNHNAVVGPGELGVKTKHLDKLDFELEAAIVTGKSGEDWDIAAADDAIFGLTVMNDWSARTLQMEEMKLSLGPAKGKDFATGIGPVLVTIDELEPYVTHTPRGRVFNLSMKAWVNGIQVSDGNVNQMNWTFAQILERISYGVRVEIGEVLGSGTVGTGCFLELNGSKITNNQWLQPGDKVDLEIEHLGRLSNTIKNKDA